VVCVDDGKTKSAAKPRRAAAKAPKSESVESAEAKDKAAKDNLTAAHKALTAALAAVKEASTEALKTAVALAVAKACESEAPKKRLRDEDAESDASLKAPRVKIEKDELEAPMDDDL